MICKNCGWIGGSPPLSCEDVQRSPRGDELFHVGHHRRYVTVLARRAPREADRAVQIAGVGDIDQPDAGAVAATATAAVVASPVSLRESAGLKIGCASDDRELKRRGGD